MKNLANFHNTRGSAPVWNANIYFRIIIITALLALFLTLTK